MEGVQRNTSHITRLDSVVLDMSSHHAFPERRPRRPLPESSLALNLSKDERPVILSDSEHQPISLAYLSEESPRLLVPPLSTLLCPL